MCIFAGCLVETDDKHIVSYFCFLGNVAVPYESGNLNLSLNIFDKYLHKMRLLSVCMLERVGRIPTNSERAENFLNEEAKPLNNKTHFLMHDAWEFQS